MGENYFGITDPGKQRTNNEDSFIAQTVFKNKLIVACVIDGVGGYAGGEIAAQLTREEILHNLNKLPSDFTAHLVTTLELANERIIREKEVNQQNEKMACVVTLALVDIANNVFYFAHVGDTRLYLFRDGSLIKITKDHSTVGFLEESGRLSEEAAMSHPRRNEVNKVLGYETQLSLQKDFIDTGESPFLPGDAILLCSDGLTDMVPAGKIISILNTGSSLADKGQQLIQAANDAGGRDNITVVLVKNNKEPLQHEITKPPVSIKKNGTNGEGQVTLMEQPVNSDIVPVKKGRSTGINRFLVILCLLFFAGFAWLFFKQYQQPKSPPASIQSLPAITSQNLGEISLADSIHASSNATIHLTPGQRIVVTDTIYITNDSLKIFANGATLVSDSSYHGPAFVLGPSCKYILLDSLVLENFNTGIIVMNKGLQLKNVRFKNSKLPLVFQHQLPDDSLVSGKQVTEVFHFTDSLHR